MRTWERGSGITMACGSGACAAFVALRHRGLLGDRAVGVLPGGVLRLAATAEGSILMRGEAFESCRGTVEPMAILARLGLAAAETRG
jgi:diaminopimelate epimerase